MEMTGQLRRYKVVMLVGARWFVNRRCVTRRPGIYVWIEADESMDDDDNDDDDDDDHSDGRGLLQKIWKRLSNTCLTLVSTLRQQCKKHSSDVVM